VIYRIDLEHQQYMESLGYIISEGYDDQRGKYYTYITHPINPYDSASGHTLKYFPNLEQLTKEDVDDGEFVDISWYGTPDGTYIPAGCNPANQGECFWSNGDMWYISSAGLDKDGNELPIIGWIFAAALIIIVAYAINTFVCSFIEKVNAPCSIKEEWINKPCWKIVRAPDCQWREFNACTGPDNNNDGFPDGEWEGEWKKDVFDPTEMIMWAIIGVVAIGGVLIVTKLIPQRKPPPQPPPPE